MLRLKALGNFLPPNPEEEPSALRTPRSTSASLQKLQLAQLRLWQRLEMAPQCLSEECIGQVPVKCHTSDQPGPGRQQLSHNA